MITQFIEPNRAAIEAPLQVVVAIEQIFAWAIQCFGVGETSCNAELHRLSLATGARDVVATAHKALVFAVSPDGTKLAFAVDWSNERFTNEGQQHGHLREVPRVLMGASVHGSAGV